MLGLALTALTAAPASATVVFSDNFDGENGGASQLNYTGYANFDTTGGGTTDLIADGGFGISCVSGSCVDLDGSPGPGTLTSYASFAFNSGDIVRLSLDVSGNQRIAGQSDNFFAGYSFGGVTTDIFDIGFSNGAGDVILVPTLSDEGFRFTFSDIAGDDPFSTRTLFFTAGQAGSLTFNFGSLSADNVGPIVDNVFLDITTAVPEPATWAMMILGFGLVGGAMRRRKTLTVQPALA